MDHFKRYYYFYKIMTANYGRMVCLKNGVKAEACKLPEGPTLVLANHTNVNDHFYVLKAIGWEHVFYVAYDLMMRNPFLRVLLELFVNPIVHRKGLSGVVTIKEMMKRLKGGYNVLLFPEGNRNFDGRTGEILPTVGKMAKNCGANLVLVRVEGGYLATPRWSLTARRGRINLTTKVIPSAELQQMDAEEINRLVLKELSVDAYEIQEKEKTPYYGQRLGEGIESALYMCPSCRQIGKIIGKRNRVACECGFGATYDPYGYLIFENGEAFTMPQLIDRQKEHLTRLTEQVEKPTDEPGSDALFGDELILNGYNNKNRRRRIGTIRLMAHPDRIIYEVVMEKRALWESKYPEQGRRTGQIPVEEIKGLAISNRNVLTVFLQDMEQGFELLGNKSFNALKYRDLYEIWKAAK